MIVHFLLRNLEIHEVWEILFKVYQVFRMQNMVQNFHSLLSIVFLVLSPIRMLQLLEAGQQVY